MNNTLYLLILILISCNFENNNSNNVVQRTNNVLNNDSNNNILGIFSYEINNNNIVRFKKDGIIIKRKEFLEYLYNNQEQYNDLRKLITKIIVQKSPNYPDAIKLKSPPINKKHEDKDFFWLIQTQHFSHDNVYNTYKNYLHHCQHSLIGSDTNSDDYKKRFIAIVSKAQLHKKESLQPSDRYDNAAVIFNNTFAKDRLVIPCPFDEQYNAKVNKSLLNISSYMNIIHQNFDNNDFLERNNNFWLSVGLSTQDYETNIGSTIFLTTHGTGVFYFHFRIDSFAYDYKNLATDIASEPKASEFYAKQIFD